MLSRRDFLRSAGGITLLAFDPIDDGLFAAPTPSARLTVVAGQIERVDAVLQVPGVKEEVTVS